MNDAFFAVSTGDLWISQLPATILALIASTLCFFMGRLWEQLRRIRVVAKDWTLDYFGDQTGSQSRKALAGFSGLQKVQALSECHTVRFYFKLIVLNEKSKTVVFDQLKVVFVKRHRCRWVEVAGRIVEWTEAGSCWHELGLPADVMVTTDIAQVLLVRQFPNLRESTRVYLEGKQVGGWVRKRWFVTDLEPWR